ncbi:glycosyltransferase family 4 protein [Flavobacterium qiangtangense]|uniref:Glycosyltransferase family 4 protein n=1 Tax=Flavobacterium qiangtangense TaxID=1442595 RepID=A0ABW1PS17_9FLAO
MKKIILIGSISDFGGREVEVNTLIHILNKDYRVNLFSTIEMTKKTFALKETKIDWSTLNDQLLKINFFIRMLAWLTKKKSNSNLPLGCFISNKLSNQLFDLNKLCLRVIKKEIDNVDLVLFCGVFTNGFFKEIVEYCSIQNKIIIFRTTGTVSEIPESLKETLRKISKIIIHSENNSQIFKTNNLNNIKIIDQTTLLEKDLLRIKIGNTPELIYGYLGRFSKEKGILELLANFKESERQLHIAGSGPLVHEVKNLCENNVNFNFSGALLPSEIASFFSKIDVLIIPSHEESGPLVGVEAMAAGKIILSTRVGAMMDRTNNTQNQFWFDINDKQSLLTSLEAIETLIGERLISIRKELRKKYIDNYSKSKVDSEYLRLIENLQQTQ